jgi:hypothetical protein
MNQPSFATSTGFICIAEWSWLCRLIKQILNNTKGWALTLKDNIKHRATPAERKAFHETCAMTERNITQQNRQCKHEPVRTSHRTNYNPRISRLKFLQLWHFTLCFIWECIRMAQSVLRRCKARTPDVWFPDRESFLYFAASRPVLEPTPAPNKMDCFPGDKTAGGGGGGLKLPLTYIYRIGQEWWSYSSTPPYDFMPWCLIKHRDKFMFIFISGSCRTTRGNINIGY